MGCHVCTFYLDLKVKPSGIYLKIRTLSTIPIRRINVEFSEDLSKLEINASVILKQPLKP